MRASQPNLIDSQLRYGEALLAAMLRWKRSRPWRGTPEEQGKKLRAIHPAISQALQLRAPRLVFHFAADTDSIDSRFDDGEKLVLLTGPRVSVVSYLFLMFRLAGFGMWEAQSQAATLFARVFPASFARCAIVDEFFVRQTK